MCIPKGSFKDPIPDRVKASYTWNETQLDEKGEPVLDEAGNPVQVAIHPTWEQVADRFKGSFGDVRQYNYGGTNFMLIEMELSFLSGEIEDLILLKGNKVFPRYRIFTNREAKLFLKGELTAEAETFR